jgi:hypothetical protein
VSKEKHAVEIEANMKRAEQSIAAARKLALDGYFDFAASHALTSGHFTLPQLFF